MQTLISLLPVVGCLAMGAVMWMMMRQHTPPQRQQQQNVADPNTLEEINLLRAEINLLKQDKAGADKESGWQGTTT